MFQSKRSSSATETETYFFFENAFLKSEGNSVRSPLLNTVFSTYRLLAVSNLTYNYNIRIVVNIRSIHETRCHYGHIILLVLVNELGLKWQCARETEMNEELNTTFLFPIREEWTCGR